MSLNESIVEDAALEWFGELGIGIVKSEIGRVKSLNLVPFLHSLFTLHSFASRTLATLRYTLLPKLLSGELAVLDEEVSKST